MKCTACAEDKFLKSNICTDSCGDGWYVKPETNVCVECPTPCKTCTSETVCQSCDKGGVLNGDQCISNCPKD